MSAAGQILYLKIEQNCIVYKRSVTLQDIASVECTDVGIRRQVLQEQIYHFYGNEKIDGTFYRRNVLTWNSRNSYI